MLLELFALGDNNKSCYFVLKVICFDAKPRVNVFVCQKHVYQFIFNPSMISPGWTQLLTVLI